MLQTRTAGSVLRAQVVLRVAFDHLLTQVLEASGDALLVGLTRVTALFSEIQCIHGDLGGAGQHHGTSKVEKFINSTQVSSPRNSK